MDNQGTFLTHHDVSTAFRPSFPHLGARGS